jgi:type II secretory pathway pseudopilin PulG
MSSGGKRRPRNARSYWLVKTLVVVVIVGILTMIAVPSFLSQRSRHRGDCSKAQIQRTYLAALKYLAAHRDSSSGMSLRSLHQISPSVPATPAGGCPRSSLFGVFAKPAADSGCSGKAGAQAFCVRIISGSGIHFSLSRSSDGAVTRGCYVPAGKVRGGCPIANSW